MALIHSIFHIALYKNIFILNISINLLSMLINLSIDFSVSSLYRLFIQLSTDFLTVTCQHSKNFMSECKATE
jgi:hypothetical protein